MPEIIDIDAQISADILEIKLGGVIYSITDIPVEVFKDAMNVKEEDIADYIYTQLSQILNVPIEQLKAEVGMKAARLAIDAIRDWILKGMQEGVEEDQGPFDGSAGMQS